ncbi:hypothetical protein [Halomontanus rarus]
MSEHSSSSYECPIWSETSISPGNNVALTALDRESHDTLGTLVMQG